ncbi:hypothetical protein FHS35_002098 [Streptomyces umbrinus]|uniref:hypothetical protein n=1 Tax=Streptomyces umbrinus TaxID=67370 RepID=UPI00167EF3B3|nr:hypothetical protein [Streptomyces umbrinus]MCR3725250.1 hypothetical protein [Streptomyces umbrinus]GHH63453.1 hypothetical protein GCM10018775_81230 [Streptomyces umbrinus]
MHKLLDVVADHADTIVQILGAISVALLTYWLTTRSRDRADKEAAKATLENQADALIVAVADVRVAAAANRILWEGPASRGRSFLLALLAGAGGTARGRVAGGSDGLSFAIGLGEVAHLLSRERRAVNQAIATVREPLLLLATAAAPLQRHSDAAVAEATAAVMAAATDIENTAGVAAAVESFGQAVRAALQPPATRWARIRNRTR